MEGFLLLSRDVKETIEKDKKVRSGPLLGCYFVVLTCVVARPQGLKHTKCFMAFETRAQTPSKHLNSLQLLQ